MKPNEHNKLLSDAEQASALLRDTLPPLLGGFKEALIENGFTDDQAFKMALSYMKITFNMGALNR